MEIATDTTYVLDSIIIDIPSSCQTVINNDLVVSQQNESANDVTITIRRTDAYSLKISLHDAAGRLVYGNEYAKPRGIQRIILPLDKILASRGIYYLTVFIDNKRVMARPLFRP